MVGEQDPDGLIGEVLASRYRIEAQLGGGAMGWVYRARHVRIGTPLAVKVLRPSLLDDVTMCRRFTREAELAGVLRHPNVVGMLDVGVTEHGLHYLVMEYAPGETLYDLMLREAPLPGERVVSILRQLCDGLGHAHDRNVIHRDFKPENVIIDDDGRVKIVDFGISILRDEALSSESDRLTTVGAVVGTPHYMAPEQALSQLIDHRADLFALGVTCFEMLTGAPPYDGHGVEIVHANVSAPTPVMAERVPGLAVDPLLEYLTRWLMNKQPSDRPASAGIAREALDLIALDPVTASIAFGLQPPAREAPPLALAAGIAEPIDAPVPRATASNHRLARAASMAPAAEMRRRYRAIAYSALVALAVFAALLVALRAPRRSPAARIVRVPDIIAAAPAPTAAPGGEPPTAEPAAPATDEPPASRAAAHRRHRPSPAGHPAAATAIVIEPGPDAAESPCPPGSPVSPIWPPGALPPAWAGPAGLSGIELTAAALASPAGVAQRYRDVGRALGALDQQRGAAATEDLWPAYLRIRINDTMVDPAGCEATDRALRELGAEITSRIR